MDTHRWNKVKKLFNQALDQDENDRKNWLKNECGDNEELYARVLKLLEASKLTSPVDKPLDKLPDTVFTPDNSDDMNRNVGKYRLIEVIGSGGMGVVYLAERTDGEFEHNVALKFLRFGMASKKLIRRFKTERQILANLQHPNIARLYDGGVMNDGTPWFSMEYIEGLPVTEYAEKNNLTINERLHLFRKICNAVLYAHQNLVIHRDLKPSNIMVTGDGEPILLDFGLARLEDEASLEKQDITRSSQNWMTLEYASPEQIRGQKLTTATDVYQLGLVLHELLTGRRPYTVKGSTPSEAEQIICNTQPAKPSTRVKSLSGNQPPFSPAELQRVLKGDLDTIILKALEKDPEMRYSSVERLSDDIYRYLNGQPILARKATFRYRFGKFIKRHSKTLVAATVLVTGLFTLNAYYTTQLSNERDVAQNEADRAEAVRDFMVSMISEANQHQAPGEPITVRDLLEHNVSEIPVQFEDQPDIAFELLRTIGFAQNSLEERTQARATLDKALNIVKNSEADFEDYLVAGVKLHLSATYTGRSERKIELLYQAKDIIKDNPNHPLILAGVTRSLAYTFYADGDYEQSIEHLRSSLDAACSDSGLEKNPRWCTNSLYDGYFFLKRAGFMEEAFEAADRHQEISMEIYTVKGYSERLLAGQLYAISLIDRNRPIEAFEVIENNIEEFHEYGGTDSRRGLGLYTTLGLVESALGNDQNAINHWNWVLEQALEIPPDVFNRTIQLNLMADRLLNLERIDEAMQAYDTFLPDDEYLTHQSQWGHRYNNIRIEMARNRATGIPQNRWLTYVEEFEQNYKDMLPNLLVFAMYDAVNRQDEESAAYWLEQIESTDDYDPKEDFEGLVSLSRFWLAQDQIERAVELINTTERLLSTREEHQGPRIARLLALQAELQCRSADVAQGHTLFQQAEKEWIQAEGHPDGLAILQKYAASCT